jgi:lysophospholipase L1-like esterase
MSKTYWFRRHKFLALGMMATLVFIATVLLAEVTVRIAFPSMRPATEERARFWVYDSQLGWAHRPNQTGQFNHEDFSVTVTHSSQALRDDEYPVARNEKQRMVVLGDSYAWGFGVEQDERFSEIIEDRNPDWEIINAGVSGYGTDQELIYLEETGINFKPDVVLLLFYENDYGNNVNKEQYWHNKPYYLVVDESLQLNNVPVPNAQAKQLIDRFLLGRTCLGRKLYTSSYRIQSMLGTLPTTEQRLAQFATGQDEFDLTGRLLLEINRICQANSSKFVLVSIPMNQKKRSYLETLANSKSIPYLALDKVFAATKKSVTFPHDSHWNPAGHALAADAMEAYLKDLKIFETRDGQSP